MIPSIFVIGAAVTWLLTGYLRLTAMSRRLLDSWRQVDVQLKRRHDLIPSLSNAVRRATDSGPVSMHVAMNARAAALTATGPADAASKEQHLSEAIRRFWMALEPPLAASADVTALRVELETTEAALRAAADKYNGMAEEFNALQRSAAAVLYANALGFRHAELFEMTDATRARGSGASHGDG